ncbi:hypothetical protein VQ03_01660 [Methylobacterium tarhaniae]|uniref:DUF1993 domain-containing protein n=1 Tax=Methylobacterium tarhaniae TaxID=1187852 RepID=A0A0J6TFK5_9HYPH|nr:DUF1993 domain-containing protein [Methylobacterium tarhaniae]KMO44702.1 hypothetical protein VQ03_01660 [Methylobacterium tarhaniae]
MSLTQQLVPTYAQMLRALSGWLGKAREHHGGEADGLMARRLAPDMFPLSSQVRFACLQAQEATYRLRGEPLPQALDDLARAGREAGERPGSLDEAQACIAETLARLDGLEPQALDAGADLSIAIELPGLTFDMVGESYARDWALPQFYFHLVTAYAILRNQGVPLGKADYVPHMFSYLRAGTAA